MIYPRSRRGTQNKSLTPETCNFSMVAPSHCCTRQETSSFWFSALPNVFIMYLKWDKSKEGKQTDPCVENKMVPLPECAFTMWALSWLRRSRCQILPCIKYSRISKTFFYPICVLALAALVEVEKKLSKNSLAA